MQPPFYHAFPFSNLNNDHSPGISSHNLQICNMKSSDTRNGQSTKTNMKLR